MYIHDLVHLVVPLSLLLWAHRKSAMNGRGDIAKVPRVDLESLRHIVRNTHKFGKNERTLLGPFLCNDELHRCSVHTVTERGDEGKVGNG